MIDVSQGLGGMVRHLCFWPKISGCRVPVTVIIFVNPYLLGEVVWSREVVSVVPRLQVKLAPNSSWCC